MITYIYDYIFMKKYIKYIIFMHEIAYYHGP